jgi:raffinose/stachyose/melibiose transport system permease protein
MYQLGFELNRFGAAAAIAIVGAALSLIINYAIHRFVGSQNKGVA